MLIIAAVQTWTVPGRVRAGRDISAECLFVLWAFSVLAIFAVG